MANITITSGQLMAKVEEQATAIVRLELANAALNAALDEANARIETLEVARDIGNAKAPENILAGRAVEVIPGDITE